MTDTADTRRGLAEPERVSEGRDRLRIGLLYLNAWLLALVLPSLHVGVDGVAGALRLLLPLPALAIGLPRLESPEVARGALLAAFPALLITAVALDPRLASGAHGVAGMLLSALSLVAALAVGGGTIARPEPRTHRHRFTSAKAPVAEPQRRRMLRRFLVVASGLGALFAVVLAPLWVPEGADARWEDAVRDGEVLTAVVATFVAAAALGTIVGPGLRAERASRQRPPSARRAVLWTVTAVTSFLLYVLLRAAE